MTGRIILRALSIFTLTLLHGVVGLVHWLWLLLSRVPLARRQAIMGGYLASLCRRLGATFVKVGQILSTRPDLASEPVRRALSQLHDRVGPFPYARVREVLLLELGATPERLFAEVDPYPVASASVAQVHRGRLHDGRVVAIKVLRPGIESLVRCDLVLMRIWARVLSWWPPLRPLAPRQVVNSFAVAVWQQLDLRIEAANNRTFAENFAGQPDVGVPALVDELCTRRVMVMMFIDGEKVLAREWPPDQADRIVQAGFRMVLQMVFVHGFIHADLHPGNLFVTGPRLVLLDLGLVARLAPRHRQGLVTLLAAWAAQDVGRLSQGIGQVAFHGQPPADPARLQVDLAQLLERYRNLALADIQVGRLLQDVIRMVRHQWVHIDPTFAMIALAIGVVEGVGRELAPQLRLVDAALPFLQQLMMTPPPIGQTGEVVQ